MLLDLIAGGLNELSLLRFALLALSLVTAITVHEFAHALAAELLGDPTPRMMGRLTLNPLRHLDPLGTLMILLARFGWGKPVQFNPFNLSNIRRDSALISLAGPAINILAAFLLALPYRFGLSFSSLLLPFVVLNVSLAVFNLIPIHPLDGFRVLGGILPRSLSEYWEGLAEYGMILLLLTVFLPGSLSLINLFVAPLSQTILALVLGRSFPIF